MIERLESEADADASHKAYCDKELAWNREKKEDKTSEIAKLSNKIDQMTSRSTQLKEEVAGLLKALAALHASQKEMDKMRAEENAAFLHNKAETEEGLQGVKMALQILRDYYAQDNSAHGAADGAAGGILGLLEVVESDFTRGLAEMVAAEASALAEYVAQTKANQIEQATKEQDVKYKNRESAGLDKATAETTSDRAGVHAELDAVMKVLARLEEQCIEKAETYESRRDHRAAEIAGLHEALEILEGETALFQQSSKKFLRSRQ
jgi:chromosome segregation ATPase